MPGVEDAVKGICLTQSDGAHIPRANKATTFDISAPRPLEAAQAELYGAMFWRISRRFVCVSFVPLCCAPTDDHKHVGKA